MVKRTAKRAGPGLCTALAVSAAAVLFCGQAAAAPVSEREAVEVANLWYVMEINSDAAAISEQERLERLDTRGLRQVVFLVSEDEVVDHSPAELPPLAYIVKYFPKGFVIVSGDDRLQPVIAFSLDSPFRWDNPEMNFMRKFLGRNMAARWAALARSLPPNSKEQQHVNWGKLRERLRRAPYDDDATFGAGEDKDINLVWDTPLWDQLVPYNDEVAIHNGNDATVPTGCTATAMAIKMRFHSWPPTGNGFHSYDDVWGATQYSHAVDYGSHTYGWQQMPMGNVTTPNQQVADLMYHAGVAVDMNYESAVSRAWPTASSMNTYFRYLETEEVISDTTEDHHAGMIASIRAGLPTVFSSSAHTMVAAGYRNTMAPYFYLNCGWSGNSNGWYNLDQLPGPDSTIDRSYPYGQPGHYVYTDAGWSGIEEGTVRRPFDTVHEGEAATPDGGHLWLKAGSFAGPDNVPVTFDRPMMLRSYHGPAVIGP